jgi:hypothetical protein
MDWPSPTEYLMSVAWKAIVFSVIWHYAAFFTRARPATQYLEKL